MRSNVGMVNRLGEVDLRLTQVSAPTYNIDLAWLAVLFGLNVKDMYSPSHRVELAPCAHDKAIIATSRKPTMTVSYL